MEKQEIASHDTICAISTPPGVGGIAVCRISGPEAIAIASSRWQGRPLNQMEASTARVGHVLDSNGSILDQAVATVFRAPRSFTGDDVVELSVHGSTYIQRTLLQTLIEAGARLAEPGEFTRRAFTAGKFDLAEAEAVAALIASDSKASHRMAMQQMKGALSQRLVQLRSELVDLSALLELELDFSEEDVEFASRRQLIDIARNIHTEVTRLHKSFATGNAIRNGIPVALVGDTNAGKSSLLNRLVGDDRAIVSDIHGTTRDTVEETIEMSDYRFRFIDTAGLRDTDDPIERMGIDRSIQAIRRAAIIVMVVDPAAPFNAELLRRCAAISPDSDVIVVVNKTDTASQHTIAQATAQVPSPIPVVTISAATGAGIDTLIDTIVATAGRRDVQAGDILVNNLRHAQALERAADSSARIIAALDAGLSGELISQDIRQTVSELSDITGDIPSTEVLATVFSRFCIGK